MDYGKDFKKFAMSDYNVSSSKMDYFGGTRNEGNSD